MDDRLLHHYERELQFLRDAGGEFAQNYPKIAGRLGVGEEGAPDPSVERLLEGVAFLTARIQLQLETEFSTFSENLLTLVQPETLTPTPSFAVVQLTPDAGEGSLLGGYTLPMDSAMREVSGYSGNAVACEFRTLTPVTLWPVELMVAEHIAAPAALLGVSDIVDAKASSLIRLRLRTCGGQPFCSLALDELSLYLQDCAGAAALYEALLAQSCGVVVRSGDGSGGEVYLDAACMCPDGLLHDALLNDQPSHYTVLKHFFAFPEGYRFVRITGLGPAIKSCRSDSLELLILLHSLKTLPAELSAEAFALFCVPAVNLFPRRCDRVPIEHYAHEYPLIVDRARPQDYQLHQIEAVWGYSATGRALGELRPMYGPLSHAASRVGEYLLRRAPCGRGYHAQAGDVGSQVFISLNVADATEMRHLAVEALCSNGGLPLHMALGKGSTDLVPDAQSPVRAIRLLCGPSRPLPAPAQNLNALRAVHQLSRGYLPLAQADGEAGAQALRDLLALHLPPDHQAGKRWLEGICTLRSEAVARRITGPGPLVFARGLRLELTLDEAAYEGIGAVLFGTMLEAFLARYIALNSFTELRLVSRQRGELMLWRARSGQCPAL
ncbi:MAG TPA: type VI secretion system baseplate subunit TssF [Serratia grimesii]|uniref:Type VI secretion system baseplate subunit TssF n=1 Tax=Serratia grimesii TaxID=82995 RepID=A0A9C7QU46_9GAMM|nr:type VI secretion system baseplate subunit TssF [Serratia grimesii]HCJ98488.1 type VI secretion system baseplate subunit TssF [Serratia grimesii]